MIWDYAAAGPRVTVETVRYALHDRIEEKLPFLRVPVLVVCGSKDPLVPLRWAKHVVSLLPEGSLTVIPGKGHALVYSAPGELVKALCPFLYIQ
ncbi:MAG: alpha/beta hydrolase [Alphaproteobacteria bacterium]|uniref:Alpha/beta hydrolase n=1 Tax=Candidatus Nitrobium versatile TaxID=2884831 RepID=A0A953LX29_9BACT|nr:alpha/beta hydrolase [Candidatus Nitrobium versatile]